MYNKASKRISITFFNVISKFQLRGNGYAVGSRVNYVVSPTDANFPLKKIEIAESDSLLSTRTKIT